MHVLIAPDAFKGSLTQKEACRIIEKGIKTACEKIETTLLPLSDGGEGMLDVCVEMFPGAKAYRISAFDPLMRPIDATYLYMRETKTIYVEMAKVSSLLLVDDEERDVFHASTYGLGHLLKQAIDIHDVRHLIIGIGGSATNDGGAGFLQALGAKIMDEHGKQINPGNNALSTIKTIDSSFFDQAYALLNVTVLCDVDNPLLGERGATYTYAEQKDASHGDLSVLEDNLAYFHKKMKEETGQDHAEMEGAGAAGGMGYALSFFKHVRLISGAQYFLNHAEDRGYFKSVDVILTGEGRCDHQSMHGKVIGRLRDMSLRHKYRLIVFTGTVDGVFPADAPDGITRIITINKDVLALKENMKKTSEHLKAAAYQYARGHLCEKEEIRDENP